MTLSGIIEEEEKLDLPVSITRNLMTLRQVMTNHAMTSDISHDDQNENFRNINISIIAERRARQISCILFYPFIYEHIQQDQDNKWKQAEEN
jgi:hypothetical protein